MKITSITRQVNKPDRYSIFVEGKYEFSLSGAALLEKKLINGQVISGAELEEYKQISQDDKLYNQTLNYVSLRMRSQWEVEQYLKRKKASPALTSTILNKLTINKIIDDGKTAAAFVSDRQNFRPTSRRKIIQELRQKHIADEWINQAMEQDPLDDQAALTQLISKKRTQTKYQDDLKLMQYLARQGFNYGDIKAALKK